MHLASPTGNIGGLHSEQFGKLGNIRTQHKSWFGAVNQQPTHISTSAQRRQGLSQLILQMSIQYINGSPIGIQNQLGDSRVGHFQRNRLSSVHSELLYCEGCREKINSDVNPESRIVVKCDVDIVREY